LFLFLASFVFTVMVSASRWKLAGVRLAIAENRKPVSSAKR
jgi:hypothetical protein